MKKLKLLFIMIVVVSTSLSVSGQQLYKCDSTKSYWTFTKDSSFFVIKLLGNVRETERKSVVAVDNFVLQGMVIDKAEYVKDGEDSSNLKVLIRYAMSEAEYFTGLFKTKINVQMQQAPISSDQIVLIWFFEMPSGQNQDVKYQLFANLIIGDKIFGLASSQFADQKLDNVKDFLMNAISTLKEVDNEKEFKGLCE